MNLYEKLDVLRETGNLKSLPTFIEQNLNPALPLRPYQRQALENFITYFENPQYRTKPAQTLFHMATGSGKTLIMAALMLYLHSKGYRNFLFFVNLRTIVEKTRDNFLNTVSAKYLFAPDITINGVKVPVRAVTNFQDCSPDAINVIFATIQGLHNDLAESKENSVTYEDFANLQTVLISDEAHHLNAITKKKLTKDELDRSTSWEQTLRSIFESSPDNVLLEFTATCDLQNQAIRDKYENHIIFSYPLQNYYEGGYSKDILSLRTDLEPDDKALLALVLSQYRLKLFARLRLNVKPVVLFKSKNIAENREFYRHFPELLSALDPERLMRLREAVSLHNTTSNVESHIVERAFSFFEANGISLTALCAELSQDFSAPHCLCVNEDEELKLHQHLLNSLEQPDNPVRAIFEVQKLDEGWDVLNLFDIVRLYSSRESGRNKISSYTLSEAQLIGRGARYYPFAIPEGAEAWTPDSDRFRRKFDQDLLCELRLCETLYYHCQNDSRYIAELKHALREQGLDLEQQTRCTCHLKDSFKQTVLYKTGWIYVNSRVTTKGRADVDSIDPRLKDRIWRFEAGGSAISDRLLEDDAPDADITAAAQAGLNTYGPVTVAQLCDQFGYALVHQALRHFPILRFSSLREIFPALTSTREFITAPKYLGEFTLAVRSATTKPSREVLRRALMRILDTVSQSLCTIEETYQGTDVFEPKLLKKVFHDKTILISDPTGDGVGISQSSPTISGDLQLSLDSEDWYAYDDHFGTSEEKALLRELHDTYLPLLRKEYQEIYLLRNEREFHLYSFKEGLRFEPDFVLFMRRYHSTEYEQLQIFIEPKGDHLIAQDSWKEKFLLELANRAVPQPNLGETASAVRIKGLHFFNRNKRSEFTEDMNSILSIAAPDH